MKDSVEIKRYDDSDVNPDLAVERSKCTFDIEFVTNLVDGSQYLTEIKRKAEALVISEKSFHEIKSTNSSFLSRSEAYSEAIRKSAIYLKIVKDNPDLNAAEQYYLSNILFPNETPPIGLHTSMFLPMLRTQLDDEQKEAWLPMAESFKILGTYAQTELGHGTNVRGLETTATYDPTSEEFIVHSPTLTSVKWWPGGLGKTCNYGIVMANLITRGCKEGVHAFLVQLRDLETHLPLRGITVGDIGPKLGFHGMDNGYLKFDNVRIPRRNMFMKNSRVSKDGAYEKEASKDKLSYGSMVFVRAMIVYDQAARSLAQAVTIATRYSSVRRQSEYRPGHQEPQVLDYLTQQHQLFPDLASSYFFYFAGLKLRETYFNANYDIQRGNLKQLPELHALSACLKAVTMDEVLAGVERCRQSCGGHGYSCASGLPKIYSQVAAASTYEGVHPVLYLQTARYLVKAYHSDSSHLDPSISYIRKVDIPEFQFHIPLNQSEIVRCFEMRATLNISKACKKLKKFEDEGRPSYEAWNLSSVELVGSAQAHSQVYLVTSFHEKLQEIPDEQIESRKVLGQLFELFGLKIIINNGSEFAESCKFSFDQLEACKSRMESLLVEIRPNAVGLVDAFDFTDHLLGSVLGRYDGNVYPHLYEWAVHSPLNQSAVHESFKHLKSSMTLKSKL